MAEAPFNLLSAGLGSGTNLLRECREVPRSIHRTQKRSHLVSRVRRHDCLKFLQCDGGVIHELDALSYPRNVL